MAEIFAGALAPQSMSQADFALWGKTHVAYVKHVQRADAAGWAIHAADGAPMGMAPSRDLAFAAIKQHEMEPLSVH